MEAHEALERSERIHGHGHDGDDDRSFAVRGALMVAVIAAFLAISTFLANEAIKDAIQKSTEESTAKAQSIAFGTDQEMAGFDSALFTALSASSDRGVATVAGAAGKELDKQVKLRFAPAEKELAAEAAHAKEKVDDANDKHLIYELSVVALQIAIVLASVSIIARRRWLWYSGGAVAIIGVGILIFGLAY